MEWIKDTINNLLETYETNEPAELCEALNIHITYEFLGEQDLLGYSIKARDYKFVVVHNQLDYYDQRIVIAHELGHLLLHPELDTNFLKKNTFQSTDKYEYQANLFATHLLLPDGFEKDVEFEGNTIEQIAEMVAIPVELVRLKCS